MKCHKFNHVNVKENENILPELRVLMFPILTAGLLVFHVLYLDRHTHAQQVDTDTPLPVVLIHMRVRDENDPIT